MINIQSLMKELFGASCYAYCIAWLFDSDTNYSIKDLTTTVLQGWFDGYIDNDGFVSKPVEYIKMCNSNSKIKDVRKIKITNKNDIPHTPTIVEMKNPNGGSHFVVCHRNDDNEIVCDFDASGVSNSWKNQEFISYREYIEK